MIKPSTSSARCGLPLVVLLLFGHPASPAAEPTLRHTLPCFTTGASQSLCFSPNGLLLATASPDSAIQLWDPASGKLSVTLKQDGVFVSALAFSPDGQVLASGTTDGTITLWNLATRKAV